MSWWGPLLIVALGLGVVVVGLGAYLRRVFALALTDHFRAAEALEAGRTPPHWVPAISRQVAWRRRLVFWRPAHTELQAAAQRVEQLERFFARGPFFQDEATRALLHSRLRQTQARWAGMTWDQIKAEAAPACGEETQRHDA